MANELKIEATITHSPAGTYEHSLGKLSFLDVITQTNTDFMAGTQIMSGSPVLLAELASIGTGGICALKNLSTTTAEIISVGLSASYPIKLLPGEFCIFRIAAPLYAQTASGTPMLQYWIWEE